MSSSLKEKMLEVLTKSNLLTTEQLTEALAAQKKTGLRLSDVLTTLGYISKRDLMVVLSQSLSIPPINLEKTKINPEVIQVIPKAIAVKYQALPVSKIGAVLTVAMVDPLNILAIDELKALTNYQVKVAIADERELRAAIEKCYDPAASEQIRDIIDNVKDMQLEVLEAKDEADKKPENLKQILSSVEDAPVVKVTNMLLAEAIRNRTSDILIEPQEKALRVRFRVDGILKDAPSLPKSMQDAIVSRIKVMSTLNIAERRLPQDGRFKIKLADREIDFRVSTMPTSHGEKVALRVLDKVAVVLDLDKLGIEAEPLEKMKKLAMEPNGMILICGPTGHGKSTTLYSILKYVDDPEKNVVTAEDPVEYQLEGINQVNINTDVGLTFSGALRSFLRQDPDVIMVGEIRDLETLDIGIKAALTGHLVLSTLHATESAGAVTRMVNMGVEPFLITSSVLMVCAQRLIRKICQVCKDPHPIIPEVRAKFKIPDVYDTIYHSKGCDKCNMSGYRGRSGLCEVLAFTPEIRDLVMQKAHESLIKKKAREQGMSTMRENGVTKAVSGLTTLEEVTRLTVADDQ
ncbi:MAG: Flp pilus assembly complex ATPase component TadA [Candidatus Omnitrophica bacterium]|nr:Flp pilus assembly complex ATPase component TadA [Candidatus Omnitrophota bacterium]